MQKNYITLTVGTLLVIIFGFMLFTFQVRETEVAIKTRQDSFRQGWRGQPWPRFSLSPALAGTRCAHL